MRTSHQPVSNSSSLISTASISTTATIRARRTIVNAMLELKCDRTYNQCPFIPLTSSRSDNSTRTITMDTTVNALCRIYSSLRHNCTPLWIAPISLFQRTQDFLTNAENSYNYHYNSDSLSRGRDNGYIRF